MLFSSLTFLYIFLPCVIAAYFIVPRKLKNAVLLLASLLFYAWGEPRFVLIMITEVVLTYIFALLIGKYQAKAPAKLLLGASLAVDIAVLGYFKYADFFIEAFAEITGISVTALNIALPVGISFYTFQMISYSVDVYRGQVPAQRNLLVLATYIAMFPQLIAGPIVRYTDIEKQLIGRTHSFDKAAYGARRFVIGLSKKVLIANALGELCSIFRETADPSVAYYWLYAVAFTLQIYFDFSGYSDMAIGLGKIFGFELRENFNYPYISKSITEFWRRWHISLGSWFRDYVYIPLGGNRVSTARWLINITIVWFLTGLWHGAAWNFVVWGLYFAVFLLLEKSIYINSLSKSKVWSRIYVMLLVTVGFVIFNAADMTEAVYDITCMFGFGNIPAVSGEFVFYIKDYAGILIIAALAMTPIPKYAWTRLQSLRCGSAIANILEPVVLIALMVIVTAYLVDGSFNPFLYFRF